ncbi:MAG: hypothetical protein JWO94_2072 [Verrucomicrobiaceae bacterium]|nr:hypothetical protein [Verrucomicrobiaceae bacterium]
MKKLPNAVPQTDGELYEAQEGLRHPNKIFYI